MTIAFNLSQLANYVNTSGKVDASTGLVNATLVANGGTGVSSTTAYAVICGGTTGTNPLQSVASVGTTGQVLTSNGAGALPTFQTAAGGSPIATVDVKTSGSSATWTIPTGVTKVRITVIGGGGNTPSSPGGTTARSGGGGGGGTAIKVLTGLTPGNTLLYTIGTGGAASGSAVSGGTSQVVSGTQTITTISATGGGGGVPNGAGGTGGIGSNGDLNIGGTGGGYAWSAACGEGSGAGGNSYLGGGGGNWGQAGRAYGGGAGGGSIYGGYAGAAGVVIFEY